MGAAAKVKNDAGHQVRAKSRVVTFRLQPRGQIRGDAFLMLSRYVLYLRSLNVARTRKGDSECPAA